MAVARVTKIIGSSPRSWQAAADEAVKRANFVRVVPPPIELVNWEEIEGKSEGDGKKAERNGQQKGLFE